jgi:hypothetical protein
MDLSIEEIESMAEASEGHMPLRCSILRVTETVNEAGNRVRVYSMIATNIPCDLTAIQQREGMMGGAIMMSSLWELFLPPDTDLQEKDKVIISGEPYEYEVVGLVRDQGRAVDFQARVTRFEK